VLTLVSADLTPAAADALARERSWELRRVRRVSAAVAEMPPAERLYVSAPAFPSKYRLGELVPITAKTSLPAAPETRSVPIGFVGVVL